VLESKSLTLRETYFKKKPPLKWCLKEEKILPTIPFNRYFTGLSLKSKEQSNINLNYILYEEDAL
jgi:hypothetical protein